MRIIMILAFVVVGCSAAAAEEEEPQKASEHLSVAFGSLCSTCHGPEGRGKEGPMLPSVKDEAAYIKQVRTGRGRMPPFDKTLISDADLREDYEWLSTGRAP